MTNLSHLPPSHEHVDVISSEAERFHTDCKQIASAIGMVYAGIYDAVKIQAWNAEEAGRFRQWINKKYPGFNKFVITYYDFEGEMKK